MRFALGGFALFAIVGGLGAQTTILHCGSLIDAEALAIRGERTIVVQEGRIASVASLIECRIEPSELDPCVGCGELPIDACALVVSE